MTIKVSKKAINLREKLNELEQDTGLKGQELMRAETVAEARSLIGAGRKNLIINGGFDVWQRGTSFTADGYTADRWAMYESGAVAVVNKKVYNNTTKLELAVTTGDQNCAIEHKIEDCKTISNQNGVLSFNVKRTVGSRTTFQYIIGINYGSGGSGAENIISATEFAISGTDTRIEIPITFPDISAKTVGAGSFISITLRQDDTSTSAYTLEFNDVQLELGSVATEFEHRSYGEELALCQRYYQHWHDGSGAINGNIIWTALSTTYVVGSAFFAGAMRTEPAVTIRATQSATNGTIRKTSDGNVTGSGFTANNISNRSFGFCNYSGSNPPLVVGEDYDFTFKADAEL